MGILTIISALLPFLITELQQYKVISPSIATLITGVEGAATTLVSSATTSPVTAVSILTSISAAVKVLQSQTTISPLTLSIINAVDAALAAGIDASTVTVVNPAALQPESPIV
jgi:hypothetical protein